MLLNVCVISLFVSSAVYFDVVESKIQDVEGLTYSFTNPDMFAPQTKCFADVGCLTNGKAWADEESRPYSPVPQEASVQFRLFTSRNPRRPYIINTSTKSIKKSPFDPSLPTMVPIHGYAADTGSIQFELNLKDALLSVGKYNVLVPVFVEFVRPPYFQAVANIRIVAVKISQMISKLTAVTGAKTQDFHLSGYNIGAQTCGYVGKFTPNIGRITALSPAAPYFVNTKKFVHLTESDALFVDVIHTNGFSNPDFQTGMDIYEPIGDQDFYPNGGLQQPGCPPPVSLPSDSVNYTAQFLATQCNHARATDLYLESILNTNCPFKAVECNSYEEFQQKKCTPDNSQEAVMGFYAKPIPGLKPNTKFYLKTHGERPYCDNSPDEPPKDGDNATDKPPEDTDKSTDEPPKDTDKSTDEPPKDTDKSTDGPPNDISNNCLDVIQCFLGLFFD